MPDRMIASWNEVPGFVKENLAKPSQRETAAWMEPIVQSIESDPTTATRALLERLQHEADTLPALGTHENLVLRVHRLTRDLLATAQEKDPATENAHQDSAKEVATKAA